MTLKVLLVIVTALLTLANPSMAGNREGAFTLSPFFGAQGFPNGEEHLDADWKWGIRAGYNFTRNLGVEIVYGVNSTVHDPEEADCKLYQYGADILYHFRPDKNLVPFVAVGFGGYTVDYNSDVGFSDATNVYFNYGGGIEYFLAQWVSLRIDFRHAVFLDNGDSALEGTGGLSFQFGGRQ